MPSKNHSSYLGKFWRMKHRIRIEDSWVDEWTRGILKYLDLETCIHPKLAIPTAVDSVTGTINLSDSLHVCKLIFNKSQAISGFTGRQRLLLCLKLGQAVIFTNQPKCSLRKTVSASLVSSIKNRQKGTYLKTVCRFAAKWKTISARQLTNTKVVAKMKAWTNTVSRI